MHAPVPQRIAVAEIVPLRSALKLPVATPGEESYAEQSKVWNAMISRRPEFIATCSDAIDVQTAVRFAREHRLEAAVRCGGHSLPGFSTSYGGIPFR